MSLFSWILGRPTEFEIATKNKFLENMNLKIFHQLVLFLLMIVDCGFTALNVKSLRYKLVLCKKNRSTNFFVKN